MGYYPSFHFPFPSPQPFIYFLLTTIPSFPPILSNFSSFLSFSTMPSPRQQHHGVRPHPAAARGVRPHIAAAHGVQSQPSKQQLVVYSSSRQGRRMCRGPRGRGRKRRKIAQDSEYSMAGITPPL